MTTSSTSILITRTAVDGADEAGHAALPVETGGVLLGFRTPGLIVVTRTLIVADPRGGRRSYLRHRCRAQGLLAERRGCLPGVVGYVGEWHTHPADQGPSRTDLYAVGGIARLSVGPVALVVVAYPPVGVVRLYGAVGARQGSRLLRSAGAVDVREAGVSVTDDRADSLEAEAAALSDRNHA